MDFKDVLEERRESKRLEIRKQTKNAMLKCIRQQLIDSQYPLRSRTLQSLSHLHASNIIHYHAEINQLFINQRYGEIQEQQQRELLEDYLYLSDNCDFQLKGQLPLKRTNDPFTIRLLVYKFTIVTPSQLNYWVRLMTSEDRTILYSHIELKHYMYITPTLAGFIIQDLDESAALQLLQLYLAESRLINVFITFALVYKLDQMLTMNFNRPFKIYHVAALVCLYKPEQGFSMLLLKRIFVNFTRVTECKPQQFLELFVLLVSTHSKFSLEDVMVMVAKIVEDYVSDISRRIQTRHQETNEDTELVDPKFTKICFKSLILTLENHYNRKTLYQVKPRTRQALINIRRQEKLYRIPNPELDKLLLLIGVITP